MLAKRVVVALDVAGRRVVKGIRFRGLRDAGDPVELARHYEEQGADEVVFLDITASRESRETMVALAKAVAEVLTVPFMVGGGIGDLVTAVNIIRSGADKVFVNTAAVRNPELLRDMARTIGSSNVVCAIDAKRAGGGYEVFVAGGTAPTGLKLEDWARRVEDLGAGEIMLTSIDRDGTGQGFDTGMLTAAREATSLPIIISGGAGTMEHFLDAFRAGADAALGASVFHYSRFSIGDLKEYLWRNGIHVRR
ncbi:imidazole glycerol phosphate synthase subunit HisF [Thermogymnomonas acidicola]|uniref:Imidazole glycerol phosphate synthase subunit HisF n=1 Tax=Thermogymnomonas acidicola TaxID=399579 RepID=A0AA37F9M1_9ARCH|nr:imidazole glycerol phosphate synthase subunit HisF [Thermogymnomonas acidicola]GGM75909.1 imidazole glycerol phosphate synthase subunit HisF [Thermogymnomonas acidicola]